MKRFPECATAGGYTLIELDNDDEIIIFVHKHPLSVDANA
jgi:hypothetical protein